MQNVKKHVIRPDGTVSVEYFEPGRMLRPQPSLEPQMKTTPAQAGPQPAFMMPQAGGFLENIGNFISLPENFGLLGQMANAIAPGTAGGNLGALAGQAAQGQLFQQLIRQLLGAAGTNPPQAPVE